MFAARGASTDAFLRIVFQINSRQSTKQQRSRRTRVLGQLLFQVRTTKQLFYHVPISLQIPSFLSTFLELPDKQFKTPKRFT